jgi:hypothetical protein
MESTKAAVADLIGALSEIDATLVFAIRTLSSFALDWHLNTYEEETDHGRRLSKRLKAWRQLNEKITNRDARFMPHVLSTYDAITNVNSVRHDLAHGQLSYGDSDFGPLVCCRVSRPVGYCQPGIPGDSTAPFDALYTEQFIRTLTYSAKTLNHRISYLLPTVKNYRQGASPENEQDLGSP